MNEISNASFFDLEDEEPTSLDQVPYRSWPKAPQVRLRSGIAPRGERRQDTMVPPPPALPTRLTPPVPSTPSAPSASGEVERAAATPPTGWLRWDAMKLNKLIVSSYKTVGFAILGFILAGLASFILINLFYLANTSWATPMMLSSTDPRVLQLSAQRASIRAGREAIAIQRLDLEAKKQDAERIAASEGHFQQAFADTLSADHDSRAAQLASFQRLLGDLRSTRTQVVSSNKDFTDLSRDQLKNEYAAHLIDKDAHVRGGYELSQIAGANVSLHERNVEIDTRVSDLTREIESLDAARGQGHAAMSYEVLHMHHEYEQSVLAQKKAEGDAASLDQSLSVLDEELAAYDRELGRVEKAPYLMAADRNVTTAFVPYDNIGSVHVGDRAFGCALSVLFCHSVGTVAEVLDGEVLGYHPLHNRELRGVLVRLELSDAAAIQRPVLHLQRAPLGI